VPGRHLSVQERTLVRRLAREGHSINRIAKVVGHARASVKSVVIAGDEAPPEPAPRYRRCSGRLRQADRDEIVVGLARGDTLTAIARHIGRAVSTVSREVRRNGGRGAYRPAMAQERARRRAPDGPSPTSSPARRWRPRSPSGSSSCGPPRRSPGGCASPTPAIR
jgi:IS30 family transposase